MNNHYVAVVAFEMDKLDKEGNPKTKKSKFLIEGVTLYDAQESLMSYLKTDSRGYDVKSIAEAKFEDIIGQKKTSKVMKMVD
jgi:hypothetical protein